MAESPARKKLVEVGKELAKDIYGQKNPSFEVPVRALSNIIWNPKKRTLELGGKKAERSFFNVGHAKRFLQTVEVASKVKDLLDVGKHASLRDVFYMVKRTIPGTSANVVDEQEESDKVIEDLEVLTGYSREHLHVNANKNGSVAGKVVIEDRGDTIDWSRMGSGGWSIPSNVEDITFRKMDAQYVLYMEKAAVWERLHEDRFWEKHKCIIISSQGQATRGIRRLLQRLSEEHKLPIYVLTDFDPYGIYIYSVIKYGSINLAHVSEKMTIPSVRFIGITADDIINYNLKKMFIKLKDIDISRLKQISEYDWFKGNKDWQRQFKMMKEFGAKVEIQSLASRGLTFISEKYLPEKIRKQDFLD
jgi:DNA topoisomerase-6 subunit A